MKSGITVKPEIELYEKLDFEKKYYLCGVEITVYCARKTSFASFPA
jgi:hypothetical protein